MCVLLIIFKIWCLIGTLKIWSYGPFKVLIQPWYRERKNRQRQPAVSQCSVLWRHERSLIRLVGAGYLWQVCTGTMLPWAGRWHTPWLAGRMWRESTDVMDCCTGAPPPSSWSRGRPSSYSVQKQTPGTLVKLLNPNPVISSWRQRSSTMLILWKIHW